MKISTNAPFPLSKRIFKLGLKTLMTYCLWDNESVGRQKARNPSSKLTKKDALKNLVNLSLTKVFATQISVQQLCVHSIGASLAKSTGYSRGHSTRRATGFHVVCLLALVPHVFCRACAQ